jgi:Transposase DDE domain
MKHPEGLSQWQEEITSGFPVLPKAQAGVLAQWCFAMEETGLCGCAALAMFLALTLRCRFDCARQRLREFYFGAADKAGLARREVDVRSCFAPLARWVLAHWAGTRLALALDASSLGDRLTILAVSVVYKGCAIPIAWKILPANRKHAWQPEWLALLDLVAPTLPADSWQVLVLTDRGLYARWLFRAIVAHHWHPVMRVNRQSTFHAADSACRQRLADFAPRVGTGWAGAGVAFTGAQSRLACTLLACWEAGHDEPWCLLTDLEPQQCNVAWYGLRSWIEQDFRTRKRGFWQWQHTRMTDPARAERVWLPMALCTFKLLAIGDATEQDSASPLWGTSIPGIERRRVLRLVRLGYLASRAAYASDRTLPRLSALSPDAWPDWPLPPCMLDPGLEDVA